MLRSIALAAAVVVASTGLALAQAQPAGGAAGAAPATGAGAPRPAATTPAAAPTVAVAPSGKNVAASAGDARQLYTAAIAGKQKECTDKGNLYVWKPAHSVGDAHPNGGFYTTNSRGTCRMVSLKVAMDKGLVSKR